MRTALDGTRMLGLTDNQPAWMSRRRKPPRDGAGSDDASLICPAPLYEHLSAPLVAQVGCNGSGGGGTTGEFASPVYARGTARRVLAIESGVCHTGSEGRAGWGRAGKECGSGGGETRLCGVERLCRHGCPSRGAVGSACDRQPMVQYGETTEKIGYVLDFPQWVQKKGGDARSRRNG